MELLTLESLKGTLHLVGVGGSGMFPLALVALSRGVKITGSDAKESKNTAQFLSRGGSLKIGHSAENIPEDCQALVISSAIKADNIELQTAKQRGIPVFHRSDLLRALLDKKRSITIAGTHGKTTTSALIAHMLHVAGLNPDAIIGGTMQNYDSSALIGSGEWIVAEADESDGSFLKYRPDVAVLTNVAADHLDHYGTHEAITTAFQAYLGHIKENGWAVVCWDDKGAQEVGRHYMAQKISYGTKLGCEVRSRVLHSEKGQTEFEAIVEYERVPIKLPLIGLHNVSNALAALAVAKVIGIPLPVAASALQSFGGVARRLERVAASHLSAIYDDYAHNPGKIAASLEALKKSWPNHEIIAVFQPHRYSRLDTMYNEFMRSFVAADRVYVLPVYAAGEKPTKPYHPSDLARDVNQFSKTDAFGFEDFTQCLRELSKDILTPTVVVTLGAGDVWQIAHKLRESLHGTDHKK